MRDTICVLVALLPLVCTSCKEEQPSEPEPSGNGGSSSTVTITPAGGELRGEGFALVVPPGAFRETAQLQLTSQPEQKPFGTHSNSGTFVVSGFPAELPGSVTVYIKHDGSGGAGDFLAFGTAAAYSSVEGIDLVYDLVSAADSAGYLVGTVGPFASPAGPGKHAGPQDETLDLLLNAITGYEASAAEDQYYRFYLPKELEGGTGELLRERFREAMTWLTPALSHDDLPPYEKKVPVIVQPRGEKSSERAGWVFNPEGIGEAIWINQDRLSDLRSSEMIMQLGESIFLSLTFHYVHKGPSPGLTDWVGNLWFHFACATWTNELFSPGTVPKNFPGHEDAPLYGLVPPPESYRYHRSHGYGMSALVHFLVSSSSVGAIKEIYDDLSSGVSLVSAIQSAVAQNIDIVWAYFLRTYLSGGTYKLDVGRLLQDAKGVYSIASDEDSVRVFTEIYRHLSAKLFLINLSFDTENPPLAATTSLVLKLHGPDTQGQVIVWAYRGDSLSFVDVASHYPADSVTVGSLVHVRSSNCRTIVAAVVNLQSTHPSSGSAPMTLEARLQRQIQYLWNRADIGLYGFKARMKYTVGDQEQEYTSTPNLVQEATGSFAGTTFTGEMTDRAEGGTFTITCDPERYFVTAFVFEYQYDDGDNWGHFKLSGTNVTFERYWYLQADQEIDFRSSGSEIKVQGTACIMKWGRYSTEETTELLSWEAEAGTDLKIRLYKDP